MTNIKFKIEWGVWVRFILLVYCAFILSGQINNIYSFSELERSEPINKFEITLIDLDKPQEGIITRTEITNLAISILNANILIVCIYALLNDLMLMGINSGVRLRNIIK